MTEETEEQRASQDEDLVTGRLQKNGRPFGAEVKASIRSGVGILFLFPPNRIRKGDKFRLLVSPDRVIEFAVVDICKELGQQDVSIDGRIIHDERYPLK